ncbi:uncharacterized protein LOC110855560 isoform X1 [Folsomia candida]|uniref:uncharacterized protein LOC110855560 isoform X1 n=1 Tax=Folsomia candida TaxID=158441 RepID=UPI001604AE02|nr:uncharacterized protein LOC110855560 isoform X1 [Folsomia candida]
MLNEADFRHKNRHSMNLRSTSSREERSSQNFDSKEARVNANNSMSKVFRNPLILDTIFAKLDLPDLMTSRLVCREWNDVASTLLGKRAYLHANKLKSSKVTPVSDKLTRHLLISDRCDQSKKKMTNVITKAFTQVSELTRKIKFAATRKEFIPTFLERMRTLGSTKVQRVDIISAWGRDKVYKFPAEAYQKLPPKPSLTSLRLRLLPSFMCTRTPSNEEFQPLVQILLDSAPNLTTLGVEASLYPDLEGCKNLKVLKFEYIAHLLDYRRKLSLTKLTDMLGQVKDSLIEVELGIWTSTGNTEPVTGGPVMSKLTTLAIHPTDGNQILNFFDEDHFPQLKTLRVHDIHQDSCSSSFLKLWRRHRGVQSIALSLNSFACWEDEEFRGKIVDLFPSVKEINLALKDIDFNDIPALSEIIEPFKTWDLERVSVHVDGVSKISVLMDVLKAMSGLKEDHLIKHRFRGVKSARFSDVDIKEDQFSPHIQDLILQSRGFKSVEIAGFMEPEIVERIRSIFEASGAPIHFSGGVVHKEISGVYSS